MTTKTSISTMDTFGDRFKLRQASGKRSAEIVAGLRALTFPSAEAQGLSSLTGRWYAHIYKRLADEGMMNAAGARQLCLMQVVSQVLGASVRPDVIVEMAGGFSARALQLAQQFPQTQVIEIDQASVIETKQVRVRRLCAGQPPANLSWRSADLATVTLPTLVGEQAVDMVIVEGLFSYFTPIEITRIVASVRASLKPGGCLVTDMLSASGWKGVEEQSWLGTWMLKRQVGRFKGAMSSAADVSQLFQEAGYRRSVVYSLKELANEYLPQMAVADTSFIVVAHNDA